MQFSFKCRHKQRSDTATSIDFVMNWAIRFVYNDIVCYNYCTVVYMCKLYKFINSMIQNDSILLAIPSHCVIVGGHDHIAHIMTYMHPSFTKFIIIIIFIVIHWNIHKKRFKKNWDSGVGYRAYILIVSAYMTVDRLCINKITYALNSLIIIIIMISYEFLVRKYF